MFLSGSSVEKGMFEMEENIRRYQSGTRNRSYKLLLHLLYFIFLIINQASGQKARNYKGPILGPESPD